MVWYYKPLEWLDTIARSILKEDITLLDNTISTLTKENEVLKDTNTLFDTIIKDTNITITNLNNSIIILENKVGKHLTLEHFKLWMDENITPVARFYNYGQGSKRPHTIFKTSLKDVDIIRSFIIEDLMFDATKYNDADSLVYAFNNELSKKYPTSKYYASDSTLYGKVEYWATAKQTIEKLRAGGKAFDCDDSMTLRYSCLYYLLQDSYPSDMWRLRGFIVDIWTGGGHALLGWVKNGANDWIPIETTFYDHLIYKIWDDDYTIRNQLLYQIRYSFDDENEYVKL